MAPRITVDSAKRPPDFFIMQEMGKMLVIAGLVLAVVGALLWFGKGFRLPGDIFVQRGNFSFGFPIVTCLVISIVLTILLNIFRR